MKLGLGRLNSKLSRSQRSQSVRYRDAVPIRRDRRELRRLWRRTYREVTTEHAKTISSKLGQLVTRRSRLVGVAPDRDTTGVVFADGTRLRLRVRYTNTDLASLTTIGAGAPVPRLEGFERCPGSSFYRLYFTGTGWCRVEVLAQVSLASIWADPEGNSPNGTGRPR